MSIRGKSVLVTGAGGFIGSHLTEELVRRGARTRAFVHYRGNGEWGWLDQSPLKQDIEVLSGDITDADSVSGAMQDCEIVFHLAALIAIPYSYTAPYSYARTNIEGTINVLQAARKHGTGRVIHTSTSETYGTARYVPIDEAHPMQGQSPYSASKIGADKMVESFFASFKTPVVTARPFNTYGPRQSARAVIPTIIAQCLKGQTIKLGNLSPTRDFNFVSDTVRGFIAAAETPGIDGLTVNFGSGLEISVGDLAQMICELTGNRANIEVDHARTRPAGSEVERLLASNTLAKERLNWSPQVSLREGLKQTIDWIAPNQQRFRADSYVV
jgi:NAD dependent epimerase/dehydratase